MTMFVDHGAKMIHRAKSLPQYWTHLTELYIVLMELLVYERKRYSMFRAPTLGVRDCV